MAPYPMHQEPQRERVPDPPKGPPPDREIELPGEPGKRPPRGPDDTPPGKDGPARGPDTPDGPGRPDPDGPGRGRDDRGDPKQPGKGPDERGDPDPGGERRRVDPSTVAGFQPTEGVPAR